MLAIRKAEIRVQSEYRFGAFPHLHQKAYLLRNPPLSHPQHQWIIVVIAKISKHQFSLLMSGLADVVLGEAYLGLSPSTYITTTHEFSENTKYEPRVWSSCAILFAIPSVSRHFASISSVKYPTRDVEERGGGGYESQVMVYRPVAYSNYGLHNNCERCFTLGFRRSIYET